MKTSRFLALTVSAILLGSCTVSPLYGTNSFTENSDTKAGLSTVYVKDGNTRTTQLVTNQLVFLFHGGSRQPASPAYELEIQARRSSTGATPVYVGGNRLAGRDLRITAIYNLSDTETGSVFYSGKKTATALFGTGTQEFANYRAGIDAEQRAARELAEFIRLDIAKALTSRVGSGTKRLTEEDLDEAVPIEDLGPDPRTIDEVQ